MTPPDDTRDVREAHRLDPRPLQAWLARTFGAGPDLVVRQFRGGQSNPTYWLSDGRTSWVLRKKPPGDLLPSAHAVDREHRVMAALQGTAVPVPVVRAYSDDPDVVGTPFFVMDHVPGRIFWNAQLPGATSGERAAIYDELGRVLAALHGVDPAVVGLSDHGRADGYLARQVSRWSDQYRASQTGRVPGMEALIEWLPANLPAGDPVAIVHGDFRLDNLIFHPTEARVLAVIDWELSTLGHPLADLAYVCMLYDVVLPGLGGLLGADLDALGIPTEASFVDRYRARTGGAPGPPEGWAVLKAFSLFRLAAIAQGVYRRGLQGNASSDRAAAFAGAPALLSQIACRLVGLEV